MMDWNGGMDGGWWILMIVLWVFLIAAVVWAGSRLFPGAGSGPLGRPRVVGGRPRPDR